MTDPNSEPVHRRNTPDNPSLAGTYAYLTGGTGWSEIDRWAADKMKADVPFAVQMALYNRAWVQRLTRFAVQEESIGQILDIGAGILADNPVHTIAQTINPAARIVYVDYEASAVERGQILLAGNPDVAYIHGDVREPDQIIDNHYTQALLDFTHPLLVIFGAVLPLLSNSDRPAELVARYLSHLAPGSLIGISHGSDELLDVDEEDMLHKLVEHYENKNVAETPRPRSIAEIAAMLAGTEFTERGVMPITDWHPPADFVPNPMDVARRAVLTVVGRVLNP